MMMSLNLWSQQKQNDGLNHLVKNFISRSSNVRDIGNYRGGRNKGARGGTSSTNRYCYICGNIDHKIAGMEQVIDTQVRRKLLKIKEVEAEAFTEAEVEAMARW